MFYSSTMTGWYCCVYGDGESKEKAQEKAQRMEIGNRLFPAFAVPDLSLVEPLGGALAGAKLTLTEARV
jgi:hypothetical protein